MENKELRELLAELKQEEETENHLIWLYQTLLDLGIENCLEGNQRDLFRKGMDVLYQESKVHKELIGGIINKYQ